MNKAKKFSAISVVLVLFLSLSLVLACKKGENSTEVLDSDTSYAFGMLMANQLAGMGVTDLRFDYKAFTEGFKAFNEAAETRMTTEEAMDKISIAYRQLQSQVEEKRWIEGTKNSEVGEAYLAKNAARSEVTTTYSGLQYEVVTRGTGKKPGLNDTVRVHYEGTFIDGTVFDSSYMRGEPLEFPLGGIIAGWTEGLQLMNEGSIFLFAIPPDLAYGANGSGTIPPSSTLLFKIELISVVDR